MSAGWCLGLEHWAPLFSAAWPAFAHSELAQEDRAESVKAQAEDGVIGKFRRSQGYVASELPVNLDCPSKADDSDSL